MEQSEVIASNAAQGREPDGNGGSNDGRQPPHDQNVFDFGGRALQALSFADTFKFLSSSIQNFAAFEGSWQIAGSALIEYGPTNFIQNLQAEIRVIPRSICIEVFSVVQKRIIHEVTTLSSGGHTPVQVPPIVQAWYQAPLPSRIAYEQSYHQPEVHPQVLSNLFSPGLSSHGGSAINKDKRRKISFGGPIQSNVSLFQQTPMQFIQPSSIAQQYPALSAGLNSHTVSSALLSSLPAMPPAFPPSYTSGISSNSASAGQFSATGLTMHNSVSSNAMGSSAPLMATHNSAPMNAMMYSAHMTAMPNSAHVTATQTPSSANFNAMPNSATSNAMFSSLSPQEQAQMNIILSNPNLQPLFMKFAGANAPPTKPVMPWIAAAQARGPRKQDNGLPDGYKRINIHSIIQAAKDERARNPAGVDTAKAVRWPVMDVFDEKCFAETRVAYYECVLRAAPSAIFSSFKSCLSTVARQAACRLFQLEVEDWIRLEDHTFMEWCKFKFGPDNKQEALRRLKECKVDHSDFTDSQSMFVAKFDTMCYNHEFIVNDIADCCSKWPVDKEDIDCSELTEKDISKAWLNSFPTKDRCSHSCQLLKCRTHIEANMLQPFSDQVNKLRSYFERKDQAVARKIETYSTIPSRSRQESQAPRVRSFSDAGNSRTDTGRRFVPKRTFTPRQQVSALSTGKKKVVAGHMRGIACGSLNNHFGLGCTKDSCPFFKTAHDKSRNGPYVWKSSDMEESVWVDNATFNELMKARPQIADNWKKARNQDHQNRRTRTPQVAALSTVKEDEDEADYNQDDIDNIDIASHIDESDSDNSDNEVNEDNYCQSVFVSAAAATTRSSPAAFETLGHEDQFYGATRFAENNKFISKTLLDPGATINIMCPTLANRSQLQRQQLAVNIFQGKRKQASVEEMVQCAFELLSADGTWVKHIEWFAVCDLGYDVLLGRRFCRLQGLTSFDEKLSQFDSLPASLLQVADNVSHVSALDLFQQVAMFQFSRVKAPTGQARYKRNPKNVKVVINAQRNLIGKHILNAANNLSSIKVGESKVVDGVQSVLLTFTCSIAKQCVSDSYTYWFEVSEDKKIDAAIDDKCLKYLNSCGCHPEIKSEAVKSTTTTVHSPEDEETAKNILAMPIAPLSEEQIKEKGAAIKKEAEKTKRLNKLRFVSYHPFQHYKLVRPAEAPLLPLYSRDHVSLLHSNNCSESRAGIRAAYELAEVAHDCRRKERQLKSMASAMEAAGVVQRGMSPDVNCWLSAVTVEREHEDAATTAEIAAMNATAIPASGFQPKECVVIVCAVNQPAFNGKRARLYAQLENSKWIIQILGDGGKRFVCHEKYFSKLSALDQQRSVPAGSQLSFTDVGIDDGGQPNIELKNVAHRQFGSEYSAELTKRIDDLKSRFPQVFTDDVTEPCDFEPMRIRLIANAILPSKAVHYRNTPKMREEVKRQIQEQLSWGVIKKCITPCVSDVLLVKRPHMPGRFRFVVNYTKLNDATVKEQLLMPDAKSQHEKLVGCKIFGVIDFSSYYRQIRLHEDSQFLTGFASEEGTFCYTRVPMGVTGACQWAQKVLQDALAADEVLGPLGFRNYFDDLPFGAKSEDEFMRIMEAMLKFCVKWRLKVNPAKSIFGVKSITHVGFVVSEDGVQIDPERTRDIVNMEAPKSIKKVQSVLGVLNYVRNFIPEFSKKAQFLTDKLAAIPVVSSGAKKRSATALSALSVQQATGKKIAKAVPKFTWSSDDELMFQELKKAVLEAPLLKHLNYSKPIFIRCDASRFGAGAVLFQYDERGFEHPVCYASRKFLASERNWSTFSQEASTVVWALERFQEYIQGYHVIVECDHKNISFVKRSSMPQLARWRLRLQDMDFSIRYLSGARNETADGLSRLCVDDEDVVQAFMRDVMPECALPDASDEDANLMAEISALNVEYPRPRVAEISTRQRRSEVRADVDDRQLTGAQLCVDPEEELLKRIATDAECNDEDVSSEASSDDDANCGDSDSDLEFGPSGEILDDEGAIQVIEEQQPAHLSLPVFDAITEIQNVHNDLSGHAGTYVTLQRVLRNSRAWGTRKQMIADIDAYLLACPCCQKMRKRSSKSSSDRHTISGSPFAELSVDVLKLPMEDAFGYRYVCVVVDSFSHWSSLVAIKNKSAFEVSRALMQVIGNFGAPLRIRSDGGSEFVNGVIAGLQRMMGVSHHVVLPYTPTANGIVERANRAILERMREMTWSSRLVRHPEHVWSDLLPLVQRALNASLHSAIGTSPARILFGNNLDLDRCLLTAMPHGKVLDVSKYVDALSYNQRIILEEADLFQSNVCARVIAKQVSREKRKDKTGRYIQLPPKEFRVGQWVLVKPGESYPLHKLAPRWLGPFQVHKCDNSEVVVVHDTLKNKFRSFLKRNLELFDSSLVPDEVGLRKVAERDSFEFPVESICGHALIEAGGIGASPVQLPSSFKRGVRPKKMFQFLVKWTGYEEPTWMEYKTASRLVQFPAYVALLPGLNML